MGSFVTVDDPNDPRLADYVGLTDAHVRRRVEGASGCFIAEGTLAVRALMASRYAVRSVLGTAERLATLGADLDRLAAPVYVARPDVLNATTGFRVHRGLVASGQRAAPVDAGALLERARFVLIVEDVNDHENMGALFRNAAAFGVDCVLLSPRACDPLYRRSIRVSLGHVLDGPFARLSPWPDALQILAAAGFTVIALTPSRDAEPIEHLGIEANARIAVMVGAEGTGLSGGALAAAHQRVRIPIAAGVDSLNVATAAALALHQFAHAMDRTS